MCEVKPHVLRYWEQEFTQLRPIKRRGNRRYYQHHEVLMIRRIRDLLYGQGFTINGARNRLQEASEEQRGRLPKAAANVEAEPLQETPSAAVRAVPSEPPLAASIDRLATEVPDGTASPVPAPFGNRSVDYTALRNELLQLRALLCNATAGENRVDRF